MSQHSINVNGMTVDRLYNEIREIGIVESDAAMLVSRWIFENYGRQRRVFDFRTPMRQAEPDCGSQFTRAFMHEDWIDGESVVQAEATAGEDGFNLRFHRIEGDFDQVKADLLELFACVASLRREVHARFDELKTEINRINTDLHQCCNHGTGIGPIVTGPIATPDFSDWIDDGAYLGRIERDGRPFDLWRTGKGMVVLPHVVQVGGGFDDPRVTTPGAVAEWVQSTPDVRDAVQSGRMTKAELVRKFGTDRLRNGVTVAEGLDILPDTYAVKGADDMIREISGRQAAALRTEQGAVRKMGEALGVEAGAGALERASLAGFGEIPAGARQVMLKAGIETIGGLAGAKTEELQGMFKNAGMDVRSGDLASWQAMAMTIGQLR
jgi:hypothetical protein